MCAVFSELYNAVEPQDDCEPCLCFPTITPAKTLYCYGESIQAYPDLSPVITRGLETIYVYSTSIKCLPPLESQESYPALKTFLEADNLQWECPCLKLWHDQLANRVNFSSETCDFQTSTTSAVTTRVFTSSHTTFLTTECDHSANSSQEFTSTTPHFTSSTQVAQGDDKITVGYIVTAGVVGAALLTATIVAVICFYSPCKCLCARPCRRWRLRRATRPLHTRHSIHLPELNYHVNDLYSDV